MGKSSIFDHDDYKQYLISRIAELPKGGRGASQKLAEAIRVHSTFISHVLKGDKDFTAEQACLVAEFFGLSENETEYLLALIEHARAGNAPLKQLWTRRLASMQSEHNSTKGRVEATKKISREFEADFYSSWDYSAISLATAIDEFQTLDAISARLGTTPKRTGEILQALVNSGLCIQENGRFKTGPTKTFISRESPFLARHFVNWRMKALQAHDNSREHELFFSMPVTIAKADRKKVRKILVDAVEKVNQVITDSSSEEVCCINIDWFDLRKIAND